MATRTTLLQPSFTVTGIGILQIDQGYFVLCASCCPKDQLRYRNSSSNEMVCGGCRKSMFFSETLPTTRRHGDGVWSQSWNWDKTLPEESNIKNVTTWAARWTCSNIEIEVL